MKWIRLVMQCLEFRSVLNHITSAVILFTFMHSSTCACAKTRISLVRLSPSNIYINNKLIKDIMRNYTRSTICMKTPTHIRKHCTHACATDTHRKVSVAVNIILSTKWTSQSPLIFFFSSPSFSLSFSHTSRHIIFIITITGHAYREMKRCSFWVKEGEMTSKRGEHRKHISYRSLPFTTH